jgi:hypothetical protein
MAIGVINLWNRLQIGVGAPHPPIAQASPARTPTPPGGHFLEQERGGFASVIGKSRAVGNPAEQQPAEP